MSILPIFIPISLILVAKYLVLKHDYRHLLSVYDRIVYIQKQAKLSEIEEHINEKE